MVFGALQDGVGLFQSPSLGIPQPDISIWRWIWPATFTNSVHETIDLPQYMIAFTPEDTVTFWMIQTHENQGILSKRKWRNTLLDPEDPFE